MKTYTVVLLRPAYMGDKTETPYGKDIYVAIGVKASEPMFAVQLAKAEVYAADRKDKLEPASPDDYELCVVFEGAHQPKLFGWQAH